MNNFSRKIEALNNSVVYEIVAGEPLGSIITIFFRNKQEHEFSLSIYCTWRLELKNDIVTGWNETNDNHSGYLFKGINRLNKKSIKKIEISSFFDLKIFFEDNFILNIFCDRTNNEDDNGEITNWIFTDIKNNLSYCINNKFKVIESLYE